MKTIPPGNEVLFEVIDQHIAVVTLNRPDARNAINRPMAEAIAASVERIEKDASIRVAILNSSDRRAFCAGADLTAVAAGDASSLVIPGVGLAGLTTAQRTKPWIAAVCGWAIAGGLELALACDMIVAAEGSFFGLPEVTRGLLAGSGGVSRLPRRIPRNIALEMILTGKPISGHRAYELGLVNLLTTVSDLMNTARALANSIADAAPRAVRECLALARIADEVPDLEMIQRTMSASDTIRKSADAFEGSRAFLEKRKAIWSER